MKTYYHISMEHEVDIELFIPRIPVYREHGEDKNQKRICVSTSIEGCVKGAPHFWYRAYDYLDAEYYDPYTHMEQLTTLLDHDEKVGHLLKVYEFDVADDEVMPPSVLHENKWVPDALHTLEHWLLQPTAANRSYFLLVEEVKLVNNEPVLTYSKFEQEELGNIESYLVTFDRKRAIEIR